MRHLTQSVQSGEIVGRRVIDKPAVFGTEKETMSEVQICARTVKECRSRLRTSSRKIRRIEDQSTNATQNKRRPMLQGHTENVRGRGLMEIVIHALGVVSLRIRRPRVVRLDAV